MQAIPVESAVGVDGEVAVFIPRLPARPASAHADGRRLVLDTADGSFTFEIGIGTAVAAEDASAVIVIEVSPPDGVEETVVPVLRGGKE